MSMMRRNQAPGPSVKPETAANAQYMNEVVPDADLYVTMHTGVWIMLYPWGIIPDQPVDWELYHHIREEVHDGISDIPIQNANQGPLPELRHRPRLWVWCDGLPDLHVRDG